jgi:membrane-associated phospholipid phosphatase
VTHWQLGTAIFLGYLAFVAVLPRGLRRRNQVRILGGVALGIVLLAVSVRLPADHPANVWVLPPALLLLGYWTSGLLFIAPMPRAERFLAGIDARLGIDALAARFPRPVAELLEFAYSGVYPLIPLALYLALRDGVSADRFWTTILLTDYVCFGMLAWFQTRPPRALGFEARWRSRWRVVNLRMLDASSVQVNTFPSGHAAEALAAALLVSGSHPLIAGWMFFNAAAISAGTVFGRYHYAADAVAGWLVALLVYFCSFRL